VGRSNGGWGERDDDDPADWSPPVAVDTRDRLASSESVTEDELPLLLPPVTSFLEVESVCMRRGMLREERGYISPPGNWANEAAAYPVTTEEEEEEGGVEPGERVCTPPLLVGGALVVGVVTSGLHGNTDCPNRVGE
jgi:hypothetical protein